jgi:K+-transporting ATPase c subunit
MAVLKGIGYLILAVAVLTVLFFGGAFIIVVGILFGLLMSVVGTTVFTASSLKTYFSSEEKHSDIDSK